MVRLQFDCNWWRRISCRRLHRRHWHIQRVEKRPGIGRPQALLLEVMPPGVNLLPRNLMALRHLRHRRPVYPNRHDNLELVFVAPETPPLQTKNFSTHHRPRIRHVVNDVFSDVS